MDLGTRPLSGMRQLFPAEMAVERRIVSRIRETAIAYGFEEYDGPVIEPVEVFLAKSGSEIVLEQGYCFEDRGGRQVVLRPEMTPILARMLASAPELPSPVRWMSFPLCFRYERPQRGRAREFRQFNCDIIGDTGIHGDLESMLVLDGIMRSLGAAHGTYALRFSSRELAALVLERSGIPPDLHGTALAAVDRIGKIPQGEWPAYAARALGSPDAAESLERFAGISDLDDPWLLARAGGSGVLEDLQELGRLAAAAGMRSLAFDASIVRGLDYYTGTVFELTDTGSGNSRAICGGGRYDSLVGLFGGRQLSGVGFGLGVLTLKLFLETYGLLPEDPSEDERPQIYAAVYSRAEAGAAFRLAEMLRAEGFRVQMEIESRSLSRQLRAASKLGARFAVIAGPEEVAAGRMMVRDMATGVQEVIPEEDAPEYLGGRIRGG